MPNNTGIKNRLDYINRVLAEDKKLGNKDAAYGNYLTALTNLAIQTNEVYGNNGNLTKESYGNLVKAYLDVTEKANAYKVSTLDSESITRMNVVNHIQKIISRDMKVLNSMDKEKPGKIDEAFEKSRAVKVSVPEGLSTKVGGQMSARFIMTSPEGKRGFFTVRTDTAQDKKWDEIMDKISKLGLDEGYMERIKDLKTDHKLRYSLQPLVYQRGISLDKICANVARALNFFGSGAQADAAFETEEYKPLLEAMKIIATDGKKLVGNYQMADRLSYDPYTRNDNKNAAMYEVAKFLGCEKLVAKAVPMVIVNGDQVIKGTFMEHADGSDLSNLKADDPLWNFDWKKSANNKSLYRDIADLQIIDYICGNVDRHKGNMCYRTTVDEKKEVKLTGIVAIDNDACFPEKDIKEEEFLTKEKGGFFETPRIFKPENFRFVNKKTADIIKNMTRAQLETILRGYNINSTAIDLAWERANHVKDVINNMEKHNITYTETIKEGPSRELGLKYDPFSDKGEFADKRSLFTGFNVGLTRSIGEEWNIAAHKQNMRYMENNRFKNNNGMLDMHEYKVFKDREEKERKVPKAEKVTPEQAILADRNKIESMNAVMKRINRLKSASKEFAEMRKAMFDLAEYHKQLSGEIKPGTKLTPQQIKDYGKHLADLDKATRKYIEEKGLTPRTGKGRERLEGALKIDHGIEDLLKGFEEVKKMDGVNLDDQEMNQENNPEMEMV